jgi:gliding motility-associated-like protein
VTATSTITITALPVATFSYSGAPYCSNGVDPSPTFSGGGVSGTFSSTAGLVFISTATGQVDLSASTAGTYTVTNTIAAAGGCGVVMATGTISIDPVLPVGISIVTDANPACAGTTVNFTAVTVNGGTPTYQWYNGSTAVGTNSPAFSSNTLSNGDVITVVMTSSLTCVSGSPATSNLVSMTINPVLPISVSIAADANPVCAGTTVNFTATPANGGLTPAYQWQVNGSNVGTNAATYSYIPVNGDAVTVILTSSETCQSNGPATSNTVTVTANTVVPVSVSIAADKNPACAGSTVNFTATPINGGTTPAYQWQVNGSNVGTNTDTYTYVPVNGDIVSVILTSSETCQSGGPATSNSITMNISSAPVVTSTQVNVLCKTASTGSVDITVTGGIAPYVFAWTGNGVTATSEDQTSLAAGVYTVTVTDAASCTSAPYTVTITEPAVALSGSITAQTNVLVYGGSNGSVTVAGAGGTGAYQYKLDAGAYQASGTFGSLLAGSYTVTVQDANLCTFDVPVTITQPSAPLSVAITAQTNVACRGTSTGSITATATGGSMPYEYSLDGGTYQSSGTFGSLAVGTYTITARDAASVTATVTTTITEPAAALSGYIVSHTDVLCFGANTGTVSVSGLGGTSPYLYKSGSGSFQATGLFTDMAAGTYIITVQDANLCTFEVTADITQPAAALAGTIMAQTNVFCNGGNNGSVTVAGSGGTAPYLYNINGGAFQASGIFSTLVTGAYTVAVQDANNCTSNVTVNISQPQVLAIDHSSVPASCPDTPDGSITLIVTGGTQPYSAIWSDGATGITRTAIPDGSYSVVVTDVNGCAASLVIELDNVGSAACIIVQEIITPNNDGFNDTWKIRNIDLFPNAEVLVYNRWGKLVFKTKNIPANEWDGTEGGKLLPTDSYHYILHLGDGSKPRSGVVSIIR